VTGPPFGVELFDRLTPEHPTLVVHRDGNVYVYTGVFNAADELVGVDVEPVNPFEAYRFGLDLVEAARSAEPELAAEDVPDRPGAYDEVTAAARRRRGCDKWLK
jgi:hypothetical protein